MKVRLVFIVYFLFLNFSFGSDSTNELKYLEELVSISSGTQDVEGVSSVQKNVASQLQNLGFEILENKSDVDTVKSTQTVAIKKGKNAKFITFVTHADTVFEKLNPFKWSDDKKRLVGSGVGDNKGGLVVTLYTIKNLLENPKFEYSIRVIISPNEETGSMGFRKQLKSYGDDSALILGMEPALEDGSIVEARKGVRWYHIKIAGREAHAGTAPENGVSACHELSKKIVKILDLNEYSKGNTINVGHVDGGKDKFNIVCGSAEGKLDFRFVDEKSFKRINAKIEKILKTTEVKSIKDGTGTKIEYTFPVEMPPFSITKKSEEMVKKYLKIVEAIEGRKIKAILTGGGADLNFMANPNSLMLDGMGPVGGNYHTADEYIEVDTIHTRIASLTKFLLDFK